MSEDKSKFIQNAIKYIEPPRYSVDVAYSDTEWQIQQYAESYDGFDENPDFQRGHVWTQEQQIKFVEAIIKGTVGDTGRTITLNCPDFQRDIIKTSDLKGFVVVDGLQRLTAMRKFLKGEFRIFSDVIEGGCDYEYFLNTKFSLKRMIGFRFSVLNYQYKRELLDYYIAFNDGGTVHSDDEINRIKIMRDGLLK